MSLELAELSDSRWKANTHKEACECLRVVFKKRRLQSPAVTNCRSVILKIVNRQADNMAKVNNHRLRESRSNKHRQQTIGQQVTLGKMFAAY